MPICPSCNAEYREGFTICADCNVPLVEPPPESQEKPAVYFDDEPVLLRTLFNHIDADMLMGALEDMGVPAMRKTDDIAGYYQAKYRTAVPNTQVDIYVPSKLLDKAEEAALYTLGAADNSADENSPEIERQNDAELLSALSKQRIKRRVLVWAILALTFLPMLIFTLINLFGG